MFTLSLMNQSLYAIVAPPNVAKKEEIQRLIGSGKLGVHTRFEGGKTMLHLAAAGGNKDTVAFLLSKGADMNVRDNNNDTPLHDAAQGGHLEAARLLIEKGHADTNVKNKKNFAPLHYAAKGGHLEVARLLIEKGADTNTKSNGHYTPLLLAGGNAKVVRLLLEKGADPNLGNPRTRGGNPLSHAAKRGDTEVARLLLERGARPNASKRSEVAYDFSALHHAAKGGYTEIVRLLLQKGDKVDAAVDRFTPLHLAAKGGHTATVKLLLENGANPNKIFPKSYVRGIRGNWASPGQWANDTLLHRAAREGRVELVALLLKHGARPNIRKPKGAFPQEQSQELAIDQAVENNQKEVVKVLLKNGSDAKSALAIAVHDEKLEMLKTLLENGDPNLASSASMQLHGFSSYRSTPKKIKLMMELLLKHGADINKKDDWGLRPLDLAIYAKNQELIKFLKSKGAKGSWATRKITVPMHEIWEAYKKLPMSL